MKRDIIILFGLAVAAPALAQAAPGMDSKKPVEINADHLEVRQEQNLAIFTGNVVAVQGDTRLKSDAMTVHYRKKADAGAETGQSVERIDVEGHVVLATPEETASGDRGVYNVDQKQVTLTQNVVLTRGQNVLKGDRLVHDFATGKSVVNAPGGSGAQQSGGRVRALFVPSEKKP